MIINLTRTEIEEQIDKASDLIEEGGKYHGMSYEDGVREALNWVIENTNEKPIED